MDPYRSAPRVVAAEAPRDAGIVDDIIGQFADPMAFYRELVQNAIDAGTRAIDVALRYDRGESIMRVAVIDRGEGMTRDVLENRLLVLFRSTKERDDSKIGKFGVGFASVLALSPRVVRVTTAAEGRRLVLHLYRDYSYELYDTGPSRSTGTTVELEIPVAEPEARTFVDASVAALTRWCRHATVPIVVDGPELAGVRIDRPLELEDALVEVRGERDGVTAVVGIRGDHQPYAGFFNHGLMLYETNEPMLGNLAFKVQDARLGHTMSRDNVRRDRRFEQAADFVRYLASKKLPAAMAAAMVAALEAGDRGRYVALLAASGAADLALGDDQLVFPLVEPVEGRRWIGAGELGGRETWIARAPSRLTAALAGTGTPVIDGARGEVRAALAHRRQIEGEVERSLTLVTPIELWASDAALAETLAALLDRAHRAPPAVHIAELIGARSGELAITGGRDDSVCAGVWLLDNDTCGRNPFAWLRRPPLVLNAGHPVIRRARKLAATEPLTAASLLARILLLTRGELDGHRSREITVEVIARALAEETR